MITKKIICLPFLFAFFSALAQTTDKIPGTDCNNIVNDKLQGAPDRSASECETQFDWNTRTRLREAFGHLIRNWAGKHWIVNDTMIKPLTEVSRASEKYFFQLSWYFTLDLKPESALYRAWSEKYQAATNAISQQPGEASSKKFMETMYEINNATHIRIYLNVNNPDGSLYYLKGKHPGFTIPGAVYAVKGPFAANLSGGGIDESHDAAWILFGNVKTRIEKTADGTETIHMSSNFPKTSHLTVQSIAIRIECNDELLTEILKEIDFPAVAAMIGH
jgi:hypothetical protein